MHTRRWLLLGSLAALVFAQDGAPVVEVTGAVKQALALSSDDLGKQDGYHVLFSLGELDPSFIDNRILLADTANGKPLSGAQGRYRLVVPKDKPGARSVRMLTRLEVVQVRE
jgi:hypothetical protein